MLSARATKQSLDFGGIAFKTSPEPVEGLVMAAKPCSELQEITRLANNLQQYFSAAQPFWLHPLISVFPRVHGQ
jgi:hypothetical protein